MILYLYLNNLLRQSRKATPISLKKILCYTKVDISQHAIALADTVCWQLQSLDEQDQVFKLLPSTDTSFLSPNPLTKHKSSTPALCPSRFWSTFHILVSHKASL